MTQSVGRPTFDFGSDGHLRVLRSSPIWGFVLGGGVCLGFLSFSPTPSSCVCVQVCVLLQNKLKILKKIQPTKKPPCFGAVGEKELVEFKYVHWKYMGVSFVTRLC